MHELKIDMILSYFIYATVYSFWNLRMANVRVSLLVAFVVNLDDWNR